MDSGNSADRYRGWLGEGLGYEALADYGGGACGQGNVSEELNNKKDVFRLYSEVVQSNHYPDAPTRD